MNTPTLEKYERARLANPCPVCGAQPKQPCTVVAGGSDPDPRLDGRKPGEVRAVPHFYRA